MQPVWVKIATIWLVTDNFCSTVMYRLDLPARCFLFCLPFMSAELPAEMPAASMPLPFGLAGHGLQLPAMPFLAAMLETVWEMWTATATW